MKLFGDLGGLFGTRRRAIALLVDNGRVWCPNRGDIEIDECAGCPRFVAYDGTELTCRDERPWWASETV